jgi:hypothetical protein
MAQVKSLPIDLIRIDGDTQGRVALDNDHITDLAQAYSEDVLVPPIEAHFDGEHYWLTDGFQRLKAARQAGKSTIACDVMKGSLREAWITALGANKGHGLRRTNHDKSNVVNKALKDRELGSWSDRKLGEHLGVSHELVRTKRLELPDDPILQVSNSDTCQDYVGKPTKLKTGRDGKQYPSRKKKPKEDDFDPTKISKQAAKANGSVKRGWKDQTFIDALGAAGKAIDAECNKLLKLVGDCQAECGGEDQKVQKAIAQAKSKLHDQLRAITEAFRTWRPKK